MANEECDELASIMSRKGFRLDDDDDGRLKEAAKYSHGVREQFADVFELFPEQSLL